MKTKIAIVILATLLAGHSYTANAQFRVLQHDEDMAAAKAEEFARVAFLQKDYKHAFQLFSDEQKKNMTIVQFQDAIEKMHGSGFPSNVVPTEFQPMPGQKAMNIFLLGKSGKEEFHYRFVLGGTEDTGYRVSGFFRGNGPYPASPMRMPLKKKGSAGKSQ